MSTDSDFSLGKSQNFEHFLELVNDALLPSFGQFSQTKNDTTYASAQIVGLPRSGTTILYQLFARTRCAGYPSNLMALFWRTPTVGARIQKHFAKNNPTLSLESFAGRTTEPLDPHEFGYFWRSMLGHSQNSLSPDSGTERGQDLHQLRDSLNAISHTFGGPVVYKNFLALAHTQMMRRELDETRFIVTERPLMDVAASLLALRRKISAGAEDWVGVRPPNSESTVFESPIEMVAFQVAELEKQKRGCHFERFADSFVLPYDDLCSDPRGVMTRLLDFIGADTSNFSPEDIPTSIRPGLGAEQLDVHERKLLNDALLNALER